MNGAQRYRQAVTKNRIIAARELKQFYEGEIEILPCSGDRFREMIIAEFDKMQIEIDRCHAILKQSGLDGAVGHAMLPTKQLGKIF